MRNAHLNHRGIYGQNTQPNTNKGQLKKQMKLFSLNELKKLEI